MNIRKKLDEVGLNTDNAVVIGSGILSALGIRNSNDIDVVVDGKMYEILHHNNRFIKGLSQGKEVLEDNIFEISTGWRVLGKNQSLSDLMEFSVLINGVRYISLEFLLSVKKSWFKDETVRTKDITDIALIEKYLRSK